MQRHCLHWPVCLCLFLLHITYCLTGIPPPLAGWHYHHLPSGFLPPPSMNDHQSHVQKPKSLLPSSITQFLLRESPAHGQAFPSGFQAPSFLHSPHRTIRPSSAFRLFLIHTSFTRMESLQPHQTCLSHSFRHFHIHIHNTKMLPSNPNGKQKLPPPPSPKSPK